MQVENGLCGCGCGAQTPIAQGTDRRYGHVKGQPVRYVRGHGPDRLGGYAVDERGCWNWRGRARSGNLDRCPVVRIDGKRIKAHRAYYAMRFGPIPAGVILHHRCGNRLCVNPDHLQPMTQSEHLKLHADIDAGRVDPPTVVSLRAA